ERWRSRESAGARGIAAGDVARSFPVVQYAISTPVPLRQSVRHKRAYTSEAPADRVALGALEAAVVAARQFGEQRPALEIVAGSLADMGVHAATRTRPLRHLARDRDAWLLRLRAAGRSASSLAAYRYAIDDLIH